MGSESLSRGVDLFSARGFCFFKQEHGPTSGSEQAKTDAILTTVLGPLRGYPFGVKIERATRCGRAVREHLSVRSVRTSKARLARTRLLRGAIGTPQLPCAAH